MDKKNEKEKKLKKGKGCLITFIVGIFIIILIAFSGSGSGNEQETTTETTAEVSEPENSQNEVPEPNTSKMVDYIAREAKKSATQAATEEKRDEAINYISEHYPNFFDDNEVMEKTMYYGYYLEYAYAKNGAENLYANLGIDTYQAVKGVYRNVDKVEDDIVQENLRQIEETLSELGID